MRSPKTPIFLCAMFVLGVLATVSADEVVNDNFVVNFGHVLFDQTVALIDEHVLVNGPNTQVLAINSTNSIYAGLSLRAAGGPNGNLRTGQGGGSPGQWDVAIQGSPWDLIFADQNRGNVMWLEREGTLHLQASPYIPSNRAEIEMVRDPTATNGHYIDFIVGNPSAGYTIKSYIDATGFHSIP